MTKPTVHINGTSAQSLYDQYGNAMEAVARAIEVHAASCPNGRDYYSQGNAALTFAIEEHNSRLERLRSVAAELSELMEHASNFIK